ncbi:MAG: nuclear transport factor 2 family protein [Rhizobacter sp.]|nr:nuclear transport factor 2 family protein [Ferruginibacter sp.]
MKMLHGLSLLSLAFLLLFSCKDGKESVFPSQPADVAADKKQIAAMLDSFNAAAANAQYDRYFKYYAAGATFNGTDATENWDKDAFMAWAKPFFDKKTTWNFSVLKRNIYFGKQADIAWFDELLSTQMKICRGSGVVVKQNNEWKVQQYVLSTTVPNSVLDTVIKIKTAEEDSLINQLKK